MKDLEMPKKLFKGNANFLAASNRAVGLRQEIKKHQKGRQNTHSCIHFDVV